MFSAQGACTAAPVTFQPTMRASRIGVHDRVLNAPLLNHTMLMTAMLGLPGSIAPDKYISSPALVVPERSNWMRWVRESYAVIQQPDIPTNRPVYPVPFNTIFPSGVP